MIMLSYWIFLSVCFSQIVTSKPQILLDTYTLTRSFQFLIDI